MDSIAINELEMWTRIGVPDAERRIEQRVIVSVTLEGDLRAAAKNDEITLSRNYQDIAKEIRALAAEERKTIERLVEDIASMILKKFKPDSVTVAVQKFPSLGARNVAVTIRRP